MSMNRSDSDSPEALFEQGKHFYLPSSGVADPLLAMYYFGKSAELGHAPAQRMLGACYMEGRLVAVDYEKARQWLTAAANQSDGQAAYHLARLYALGLGTAKNWALAYELLCLPQVRELAEARQLKEKLKAELLRCHATLAERLAAEDEKRRSRYTATQKRFIQPWASPGRPQFDREEFEAWLRLNLSQASEAETEAALRRLMERYHSQMEEINPAVARA